MDPSTIASWGSPEDRPLRDQMRGLLSGRKFMDAYCAAEGGKKESPDSWWFKWVAENTVAELRWMWSSRRAFKDEHREAYAQVAGDLILKETARGIVPSTKWFRTDISEVYGWLFEPACLQYDGWKLVGKQFDGKMVNTWTRASG